MSITIRRAVPADFLAVAALDRQAWSESRQSEYIPDGEHAWRLWTEHGAVIVARIASDVVGAALAFPTRSGPWCLHKIFVHRDHRGMGLGSKLMAAALEAVDGLGVACFLTVDPLNATAIKLYEKWGFTEKRLVKGYYRPEEDRYVMTRRGAESRSQRWEVTR